MYTKQNTYGVLQIKDLFLLYGVLHTTFISLAQKWSELYQVILVSVTFSQSEVCFQNL